MPLSVTRKPGEGLRIEFVRCDGSTVEAMIRVHHREDGDRFLLTCDAPREVRFIREELERRPRRD